MFKMLIATLLLVPTVAMSADGQLKEGKWEVKVAVKISGMPNMPAMPEQVSTHTDCVKKGENDLKNAPNIVADKSCKVSNVKVSGPSVSWNAECDMDGIKSKSKGSFTNKGEAFDGSMDNEMALPEGMSMKSKAKVTGKWLAAGC